MKHIVSVVLLGAATMLAASALAQTATKPPAKPAPATKTAAAAPRPSATHPVARPVGVHPTIIPRRPVFVPPPPVIELDEIAVVPDLPTVLDTDTRETYRRIFQAQASGQFAQADADIARLNVSDLQQTLSAAKSHQTVTDFLLNIIPKTIVGAFAEGEILQVLFFSVLFGIAISGLGEANRPVIHALDQVSKALMRMIAIIIKLAPLAVFGAMSFTISKFGLASLAPLGKLMACIYLTCIAFVVFCLGRYCGSTALVFGNSCGICATSYSSYSAPLLRSRSSHESWRSWKTWAARSRWSGWCSLPAIRSTWMAALFI